MKLQNSNHDTEDTITFIYNIALMSMDVLALMIYLIYFLAHYAHPQDSAFGGSTFAKIMIYIGYFLGYLFLLTIQFDIYLTQKGFNIKPFYYIIQWSQLIYVFILGPSLLVFYESNESMPMVSLFSSLIQFRPNGYLTLSEYKFLSSSF